MIRQTLQFSYSSNKASNTYNKAKKKKKKKGVFEIKGKLLVLMGCLKQMWQV